MAQSRVVVIGGGVIGVSTAYYLAEMGQRVTLLEQHEICSGSSQGNAGQITPGHMPLNHPGVIWRNLGMMLKPSSPLYIPLRWDWNLIKWLWQFHRACAPDQVRKATRLLAELGHASFALFEDLKDRIEFGYNCTGRLEVCREASTLAVVKHEAEMLEEFGYTWREVTADEVREMEPAVTTPITGGVYFKESAYCNPAAFVVELSKLSQAAGVEIREQAAVSHIEANGTGPVRVRTGEEVIEADHAVLAGGAWTPELAEQLGLRLPIQPGKGYHLDIDAPTPGINAPTLFVEERVFVTPIDDFIRLAGTMELSGFNLKKLPARIRQLSLGAGKYIRGIAEAKVRSEWCHLRPMAPDGIPMVGPTPKSKRVWIASGHGMLGLTQGPITGKLVAEGIVNGKTSMDITPLRPERFSKQASPHEG